MPMASNPLPSIEPNDFNDPWRFSCTTCGSTGSQLKFNQGCIMSKGPNYRNVYCESCGMRSRTVYDKKTGTEVKYE